MERHGTVLGRRGVPRADPCPACARYKFDGRLGVLRCGADILVGMVGACEEFVACVLEAGTPALLRSGEFEALGV